MIVTIEPLTSAHLRTSALRFLLGPGPPRKILSIEPRGGLARAISCDAEVVGLVTVMPDSAEVMIAIHPGRHRRGIATEALRQVFSVARDEKHIEKVVARAQI